MWLLYVNAKFEKPSLFKVVNVIYFFYLDFIPDIDTNIFWLTMQFVLEVWNAFWEAMVGHMSLTTDLSFKSKEFCIALMTIYIFYGSVSFIFNKFYCQKMMRSVDIYSASHKETTVDYAHLLRCKEMTT